MVLAEKFGALRASAIASIVRVETACRYISASAAVSAFSPLA
jgi:hypothetical protein